MKLAPPLLVAALATAWLTPRGAAAQVAPTAEALDEARRAYNEGTEAEKAGNCPTAIERFEAAAKVKDSPAVRLRIGRCREKLGQLRAAREDYLRAKALAEGDAQASEVAEQLVADLEKRLPTVKVEVVDPPAALEVTLDGAPLKLDGAPQRADPGRHVVVARAAGFETFEASFELVEGEVHGLTVALRADAAPPPPPVSPVAPAPESPVPWLPIGLYAGAGVTLGIGVPVLLTSLGADSDLDARCFDESGAISAGRDPCLANDGTPYGAAEQADIASEADAIDTQQIVGWILVGTGVATAGVATVLLLVSSEPQTGDVGLRFETVTPLVGPGRGGLEVGGRF